jgi:hypothetical protein
MSRLALAVSLALIALLGSCSGEPPVISRVSAQLLYVNDLAADTVSEELAIYVVPEDEDGLDDLEYLHVISDRAELYWSLDSSSWTSARSQNQDWIGTARLAVPPDMSFPRGTYRVLLYDLAGESDEAEFSLGAEVRKPADIPFPRAQEAGGKIVIDGPVEWYTLLVYTSAGTYVRSFPTQAESTTVESIRRTDAVLRAGFTYYVYAYWPQDSVGLLTGPHAVD